MKKGEICISGVVKRWPVTLIDSGQMKACSKDLIHSKRNKTKWLLLVKAPIYHWLDYIQFTMITLGFFVEFTCSPCVCIFPSCPETCKFVSSLNCA